MHKTEMRAGAASSGHSRSNQIVGSTGSQMSSLLQNAAAPVVFTPSNLNFGGVVPGSSGPDIDVDPSLGPPAISFNGGVQIKAAPSDALVTARIEGDTMHFQVRDIIVMEWVLEPVDLSELPPGHHGPRPKVKVLEVAAQSDGTTPLAVKKDQFVLVRVKYDALRPEGSFLATLSINGDTWQPIQVPVMLFLGGVVTTFDATEVNIVQGTQVAVPMTVASIAGPAVDVAYVQSTLLLHTGVAISPTTVHVEGHRTAQANLTLSAQLDAPVGPNTLFVEQIAFNKRLGLLLPVNILAKPNVDIELQQAIREIEQFYNASHGILTVGSPIRSVERLANGNFRQAYTFGSIIKPLNEPPQIGERVHLAVEIAGVRCFGTDDADGKDDPYLITTVYAIDPSVGDRSVNTQRIGPDGIGDIHGGNVFAQGRQLANDFAVPGDGEIRIHVEVYDKEAGDPEDFKKKASLAAQGAIASGLALLAGSTGIGAAILSKVGGLLDTVGDAIGGVVAGLVGDDLIGQHDFIVTTDYLKKLVAAPGDLDRTSDSIQGITFNFPPKTDFPENDSPAGHSWLFDNGSGTYRAFFRIKQE
jgi:hypothetical protein